MKKYLNSGPVVVVCPSTIKEHWKREASKHINMRAEILSSRTPPTNGLKGHPSHLYIVNYDILGDPKDPKSWANVLKKAKPQLVVLDESHYCRTRDTQRTKASQHLCKDAPHVIAISGTPMVNRPAELWPVLNIVRPNLFPSFWAFGSRYCLPYDAPILMGDLTEKSISDVKIGDEVIGWKSINGGQRRLVVTKVQGTIQKKSPLQTVTLETGKELICTPDHQWATGRPANDPYCYSPATTGRLGGGGRGCASKIMEVFSSPKPIYPKSKEYRLGYIHGAWRGDGHCVKIGKTAYHPFKKKQMIYASKYSIGFGCKDKPIIKRLQKYLHSFGLMVEIKLCSDSLYRFRKVGKIKTYRFLTKTSGIIDSDEWWAGFLAGIYDTEGSGRTFAQYQIINPVTYKMIQAGLSRFQFKFVSSPKSIWFSGGRSELLRLWAVAAPVLRRKLCKFIFSKGGKFNAGGVGTSSKPPFVTKIKPLHGIHKTYTLTTGTGNYVAYGHGSKNCHPEKTPWGWKFNGASNLDELHSILRQTIMVRRLKKDVMGQLPTKIRTVIPLEIENRAEYTKAVYSFLTWLRKQSKSRAEKAAKAERLVQMGYLKRLAGQFKIKNVLSWIADYLEETGEKLLIFAVHKTVVKSIHERFKNISVVVDGSVTGPKRQKAIDSFNTNPNVRMLVGNVQAAGVGWSCKATSTVAFVELPWVPGEVTQAEDRIHGIGRGTGSAQYYFLVAKNTIEEKLVKILNTKQETLDAALDGSVGSSQFDILDRLEDALLKDERKAK